MRKHNISAALALAAILAGCATPYGEAPLAANFPTGKQPKLQAAAHWNVIAYDVAQQLAAGLKAKPTLPALYVNQVANKTDFDLIQELNNGQRYAAGTMAAGRASRSGFTACAPRKNCIYGRAAKFCWMASACTTPSWT